VLLDVLPEQCARLVVHRKSHGTGMYVLGLDVCEQEVQVVGEQINVLDAAHGAEGDLLAVN